MNHVMLDLETMGNSAGCAIVSIGAVYFDPKTKRLGHEFYKVVDLQSCLDAGLRVDASTVYWWLEQSAEARAALRKNQEPLADVLQSFVKWLDPEARLWAHGATFDIPILEAAFKASSVGFVPWKYWAGRDTRTLFALTSTEVNRARGIAHNALDDAKAQAEAVIEAYAKIKK